MKPTTIEHEIYDTLIDCGISLEQDALNNMFRHPNLEIWREQLPDDGNTVQARTWDVINLLKDRFNRNGENGLVLFLQVANSLIHEEDNCSQSLSALEKQWKDEAIKRKKAQSNRLDSQEPTVAKTIEDKNRANLLQLIHSDYIEQVLENPRYQHQHNPLKIELDIDPDAVTRSIHDSDKNFPPTLTQPNIQYIFYEMNELDRSLLILGDAGSGKTITLLMLLRDAIAKAQANSSAPIPIYLNLSSWVVKKQPIKEWMIEELLERHRIPHKVSENWFKQNKLLPLLDGLDSVTSEHIEDCIEAINRFYKVEAEKPQIQIAVCSRSESYKASKTKLAFRQAFSLKPINLSQIEDFIDRFSENETTFENKTEKLSYLKTTLIEDKKLQDFAKTPLIFNMLLQAFQKVEFDTLSSITSIQEKQSYLFSRYVAHLFETERPYFQEKNTPNVKADTYSQQEVIENISWLSKQMVKHPQQIFLLDRIQPSWLPASIHRYLYVLLSRLIVGLIGGLVGGIPISLGLVTFTSTPLDIGLIRGMGEGLLGCLTGGLIVAILDIFRMEWWDNQGYSNFFSNHRLAQGRLFNLLHLAFTIISITALVGFGTWLSIGNLFGAIEWLGISQAFWMSEGRSVGLLVGICFGLIFGFDTHNNRRDLYHDDINPVEVLSRSNADALKGGVYGLLAAVVLVAIRFSIPNNDPIGDVLGNGGTFFAVAAILLGAFGGIIGGAKGLIIPALADTSKVKDGISLSLNNARNMGLLIGILFTFVGGTVGFLIDGIEAGLTFISYGALFGVLSWFIYGGVDAIKHYSLRFILFQAHKIPRDFTKILDYASERLLLQKIGTGYRIQNLLIAYFANLKESPKDS